MMNKLGLIITIVIFSIAPINAKDVTIEGNYHLVIPPTMSEAEARETALNRAIVQALADAFGTIVTSETWTDLKNDNSVSNISFWQMGNSFVKGEWLRTLSEPQYTKYLSDKGEIVLEVKIKGIAREIETSPIQLKTFLSLPSVDIENNRFRSGSRFTLNFTSPVNGFLSVYIADEEGGVTRLLPYSQVAISCTQIKAMVDYEFFTSQNGTEEQYTFETQKNKERNIIYVLFSTKEYSRPLDRLDSNSNLRILKYNDFIKWTSQLKSVDNTFKVTILPVEILTSQ